MKIETMKICIHNLPDSGLLLPLPSTGIAPYYDYEIPEIIDIDHMLNGSEGFIKLLPTTFGSALTKLSSREYAVANINKQSIARNTFFCPDYAQAQSLYCSSGGREYSFRFATRVGIHVSPTKDWVGILFPHWDAILHIRFDANFLAPEGVVYLLEQAGKYVGNGHMRPEMGGSMGRWQVDYRRIQINRG